MPIVFLSPSTQDWNPYVTGSGSEEYWMNRIVDAMEPYLRSNGIRLPPVHDKDKALDLRRKCLHILPLQSRPEGMKPKKNQKWISG